MTSLNLFRKYSVCWLLLFAASASSCAPAVLATTTSEPPSATAAVTQPAAASPTNKPALTQSSTMDGYFDAGGHKLHMTCLGSGSPTVVYLHGYIQDPSGGGAANARGIPSLLKAKYRICVYDRANVGRSDSVPGPLTGKDSVADLHALLAAAHLTPPYVLLGASWGGLIADMFAASYPNEVAGMVLLDPALPGDYQIEERFLPPAARDKPDDWKTATEQIDQVATFQQAQQLAGHEPKVPLVLLATKNPEWPPSNQRDQMVAAIRQQQQDFVTHFAPGELMVVDVQHFMEPVIPQQIAQEVDKVIQEANP